MNRTLFQLSEDLARVEDALYESGGELTPELEDELMETKEGLAVKADGYGTLIRKFRQFADNCKAEIDRLTKLKKTAENAEKRMMDHIEYAMDQFGFERLEGETTRFFKTKSPKSLDVDEEVLLFPHRKRIEDLQASLPPYITIEAKVSKKVIKDSSKETGILPAGCQMKQTEYLKMQ